MYSTSSTVRRRPVSFTEREESPNSNLPIKQIPGNYGLPFIGPIKDRLDYFYNQGRDEFFKTRIQKYGSTVFRANMPPGPFMASNPNVVVLVDAVSFPVLFGVSKVEKRDLLTGTYMPSTALTGGYRVCAYLDPSEPNHTKLKRLIFLLLSSRHSKYIPEFHKSFSVLFDNLETEIKNKGEANFNNLNDKTSFDYLLKAYFDKDPAETKIESKGSNYVTKWLFFQLCPLITLGLPKLVSFVEDILLHTFPLPPFLVKSDYMKLYDVFYTSAAALLDEAEKMGLNRKEACHNLLFVTCFNAYGGMKILFPALMKWVGLAGEELHKQLADEIRAAVKAEGVKKGEMIFGFQPFATKDPKIFDKAEEYIACRFVGEGEKLLKYVFWSNGRETENPTEGNKQCPGKDFVVLVARLLLVELFLRYDSFTVEASTILFGPSVTVKSLTSVGSPSQ
ncbi:PREDICTED: allene oxide synthase 1, chloroplastic-like [Nelumbo nucifera]|uniref:Allene oxide synthase 1, chloroplastic-like n=1 Tax=Nelumbo nucifera TaxID=4432 RepID=A0A1U8Q323_NELNU|nr:PREDICTED: allene oxide synthase 1, chloroplastic-like [Nelumbo nucifera]